MARIQSVDGTIGGDYKVFVSDEEKKLLATSEEGIALLARVHFVSLPYRHGLSGLSEGVNTELQRLKSLPGKEAREARLQAARAQEGKEGGSRGGDRGRRR
jgi:hypothetical protein